MAGRQGVGDSCCIGKCRQSDHPGHSLKRSHTAPTAPILPPPSCPPPATATATNLFEQLRHCVTGGLPGHGQQRSVAKNIGL